MCNAVQLPLCCTFFVCPDNLCVQITVSNQPKTTEQESTQDQHTSEQPKMSEGVFVAVYLEKYKDERFPMIGQVTELCENGQDIKLDWYIGCYSGQWKICKRRGVVWNEVVPLTSVLSQIVFTKNMKLKGSVESTLRSLYSRL